MIAITIGCTQKPFYLLVSGFYLDDLEDQTCTSGYFLYLVVCAQNLSQKREELNLPKIQPRMKVSVQLDSGGTEVEYDINTQLDLQVHIDVLSKMLGSKDEPTKNILRVKASRKIITAQV